MNKRERNTKQNDYYRRLMYAVCSERTCRSDVNGLIKNNNNNVAIIIR